MFIQQPAQSYEINNDPCPQITQVCDDVSVLSMIHFFPLALNVLRQKLTSFYIQFYKVLLITVSDKNYDIFCIG